MKHWQKRSRCKNVIIELNDAEIVWRPTVDTAAASSCVIPPVPVVNGEDEAAAARRLRRFGRAPQRQGIHVR